MANTLILADTLPSRYLATGAQAFTKDDLQPAADTFTRNKWIMGPEPTGEDVVLLRACSEFAFMAPLGTGLLPLASDWIDVRGYTGWQLWVDSPGTGVLTGNIADMAAYVAYSPTGGRLDEDIDFAAGSDGVRGVAGGDPVALNLPSSNYLKSGSCTGTTFLFPYVLMTFTAPAVWSQLGTFRALLVLSRQKHQK